METKKLENIFLSVIVPAYNEEKRIEKTLRIISNYLRKQPYLYEIIVVGDGPRDNTSIVVEKMKSSIPHLVFIDRKINRGKGYTVREGMLKACGKVRLFTDADNSTDISHFDLMVPFFDKGSDIVICSRDKKDVLGARQAVPQNRFKRVLGNMGNIFIQFVAVRGIWDTQCGFKAMRDYVAKKIYARSRIDHWGFDIETLALARKFDYKISIVPANWINDLESKVSAVAYFQVLWETIKIRWYLITGRYEEK